MSWLNDIVQAVIRLVPRLEVIPPTHAGVRFGPGGKSKRLGPGLGVWWPLIHVYKRLPITVQSVQVSARALPVHAEGGLLPKVALVETCAQYTVEDPVKAAANVVGLHALVENRCRAEVVSNWTGFADAKQSVKEAEKNLKRELGERYGLRLERLDLTAYAIKAGVLLTNGNYVRESDEEAT
jgi:hypothetical protein